MQLWILIQGHLTCWPCLILTCRCDCETRPRVIQYGARRLYSLLESGTQSYLNHALNSKDDASFESWQKQFYKCCYNLPCVDKWTRGGYNCSHIFNQSFICLFLYNIVKKRDRETVRQAKIIETLLKSRAQRQLAI